MAVDGHLNFDTIIKTGGFQKGLKNIGSTLDNLKGSVMNLAGAFGIAFSAAALISFSKSAKEAYNVQLEGETKLETVLGKHLGATKEQIKATKEYASALQEVGVIGDEVQLAGLQELSTYIENPESLKTMNGVLNDMLAQQYGLNASAESAVTISTMLGKVLAGQTSALSRYGYTFDEAQEKLLKYGTEEQRVATLADVVLDSVGGMNEALAQTPAGRMKQLENTMSDIKEQFGEAVTQLEILLLPALKKVASTLQLIAEKAKAVTQALSEVFGVKNNKSVSTTGTGDVNADLSDSTETLADNADETADSYEDMAKAAEDANKANREDLAAFDELNVKAKDITETEDTTADLSVDTEQAEEDIAELDTGITIDVDADTEKADSKLTSMINKIKGSLEDFFSPLKTAWEQYGETVVESVKDWAKRLDFEPLKKSFESLRKSAEPVIDVIGEGLSWFIDNILEPLGKWTIEEALPAFFDALSGAFELIAAVGENVGNILKMLWDNFLSKIASFIGDAIVAFLEVFGQFMKDVAENQDAVTTLILVAEVIGTIIIAIISIKTALNSLPAILGAIPGILSALTNPIMWIIIALVAIGVVIVELVTYWDTLKEAWLEGVETIKQYFINFADWFKDGWSQFANWWTEKVTAVWEGLKDGAKDAWESVKSVFGKVADFFKDTFTKAWTKVQDVFNKGGAIFTGIKDGIVDTFKRIVNSLIDSINNVIRTPFDGINSALSGIRNVEIAGWNPFRWLPTINVPQIPHLAAGTVVPANYGEFAAVLGDNKREPEVVSPLSTMKQAVIEAMAEVGFSGGDDRDIVINIDGREVFRVVRNQDNHYKRMHGKSAFA